MIYNISLIKIAKHTQRIAEIQKQIEYRAEQKRKLQQQKVA